MKKETTFSQYLAKEKLKGNFTYDDLQMDEGIKDWFNIKKSWYDTKKHLSGNLKEDKIELWRLNFDFTDRGFRKGLIEKCAMAVKDSGKGTDIDGAREEILKAITDAVNGTIDKIVGLARGENTRYDNASENPGDDEDERLYTDEIRGYKYSWVQDGHLYMYYDTKDHAEDFKKEKLMEQKIIEVGEDVIQSMIKIEKCTRRKDTVYDKVKSEDRGWKESKSIAKAKFTNDNSKLIFDKIKDEILDAVKNNRYGKDVKAGRVVWEITDSDIEDFIAKLKDKDPNLSSDETVAEELNKEFKEVKKVAADFHFLYGRGSQKGNIFLNFETLSDAEAFHEQIGGENFIGTFKEPKEVKINSNLIAKNKE